MSARDDAAHRTTTPRPPGTGQRVGGAMLAGAALGFLLAALLVQHLPPGPWPRYEVRVAWRGGPPTAAEWPRPPRPGEATRCLADAAGPRLAVRAPRAGDARELAAGLQRARLSGMGEGADRRAALRTRWRAARPPDPEPWLARATRSAALVRGRLLLVGLLDPRVPEMPPPASPSADRARAGVEATQARVARLALAARPDSLQEALVAGALAEGEWLRAVAAHPAVDSRERLAAVWSWHERAQARLLDSIERRIEAHLPRAQAELVPPVAFDRALSLERLAPDPAAVFFVSGRWREDAEPVAVAGTWAMLLGSGALAGALAGLALALPRRRAGRVGATAAGLSRARLSRDAEAAWRSELGWLHVVSGPDRARIADGVGALAGSFLARRERVLAVDAGQDLRLHERFGGDARWGLSECLAGEVPLLGAVQATGSPGFYLLARGESGAAGRWEALSPILEEARQHFDRVILTLGAGAPSAAALPLGGRVLEAWWAEPGEPLSRRASALGDRIGIRFVGLDLDWLAKVEHERQEIAAEPAAVTGGEPAALSGDEPVTSFDGEPAPLPGEEPVPVSVEETAAMPDPDAAALPVSGEMPGPPTALDWDPEVRDRLRFLVWMKRVRAERQAAPVEVGTDA